MPHVASSALRVPGSRIRQIAEMAMAMEGDVLRLYFGESNLPTPRFIAEAAAAALRDGFTYYTENAGLPSLRQALAAHTERLHGATLDPGSEIVVTASGVQALALGIRCLLDPGDEAICLTPAWPNGAGIVALANAMPVEVPHVLDGGRYTVDFDALEAAVTPRTRLLLYTSPSNPLGWVATEEEQDGLLAFARRHGLWLVADEVYERLYYAVEPGGTAPSILRKSTREDAVMVIQSFSKAYCMTGWRLGWLVCRRDAGQKAGPLNELFVSHATSFIQKAGEVALADGEQFVRDQVVQLRANRDLCLDALRQMPGVTVPEPEGAFYLFPRIDGLEDSFELCKRLLVESRVGFAPGSAFGEGGEGSVRICYASEPRILEAAMQRLEAALAAAKR
jgi:aspartate/methionine/tyrosine aminotransferase